MSENLSKPLVGKVALVTGAVRRIGRAIALRLAQDGAAVVIHTRASEAEGRAVADEVAERGVDSLLCLAEITDEVAVRTMIEQSREKFGRLDILVNNAAIRGQVPFLEMTLQQWREVTGIILDGAFIVTRACLPLMLQSGEGGRIINIGGATAYTGAAERAHVVTGKAGLGGFTRALAMEFADRGITVNCVVPGRIGGQRSKSAGAEPPLGVHEPIVGRFGTPDEVAEMVRPLWLPTGAYVTGQTIHVNGGLYMG
jgi:3-oxoacyl-[acyl-carrier protein] reductase